MDLRECDQLLRRCGRTVRNPVDHYHHVHLYCRPHEGGRRDLFLPDPIIEQDLVLSNFTQDRDIAYGYYETLDNKQYSVDLYNIYPTILNSYENVKLAIAFDTKTNYEAGYLNPKIFEMMYQGAVIALPQEHKFFHSLFTHQVISPDDFVSIKWLLSCYQNISYGCAVDVTIKLKNEWNILTEKYFLDVLNGL